MSPQPHPRPTCWRCQDWREVDTPDGPKPCPDCQTKNTNRTAHRMKGTTMKIRIAAVSATMFVALLGAAGPAAAATSADYGTADQHAAVTTLAAGSEDDPAAPGTGNNPAPNGQQQAPAPQVQQPGPGQQAPAPTQLNNVQTQAGGGTIAVSTVAVLLLGLTCWFLVKKGGFKAAHLALGVCLGVLLAGTFVGPLVQQVTGSAVTSFGSILGGM